MKDVRLICEPNEWRWPDGGTVASFRSFFAHLPANAAAFVNGNPADEEDYVEPGDTLEFLRLFTRKRTTYRSIDAHWEV